MHALTRSGTKESSKSGRNRRQGLAQKWLYYVNKHIKSLHSIKVRLNAAELAAELQDFWLKEILLHGKDLVEIKARLEGVQYKSEKPAPNLFAKAENAIDKKRQATGQGTPAAGRGPANLGRWMPRNSHVARHARACKGMCSRAFEYNVVVLPRECIYAWWV